MSAGPQDLARLVRAGWADVLLTVRPLMVGQIAKLRQGAVVVGYMQAHGKLREVEMLRDRRVTSFAMELIPRISRAQSMDALSSQAAISGYKAVLIAANELEKFMQTRYGNVLASVKEKKNLDDALKNELNAALAEFQQHFKSMKATAGAR